MLRRVDTALLNYQPNMFGKGRVYLIIGRRSAQVGVGKWNREQMRQFQNYQAQWPAFLAEMDGRRYWLYMGRVFSDNENLTQEQVHALLVARDQQHQRQVDRAVSMHRRGQVPTPSARGSISDDVKHFVFNRDRGRCRNCASPHELQFDHIIPIALGGSSEPENLQLLCGPCNRAKGAGLTNRGRP